MEPNAIREISNEIVNQELLNNWVFYLIFGAVALIGSALGSFLSSYFRKRAETLATKADMDELLKQIRATTEAAEEIRTAVSHTDWVAREWKTIRRTKLEELLTGAHELEGWLNQQQSRWMFGGGSVDEQSPADRVNVLAALYFPELITAVCEVIIAHGSAHSTMLGYAKRVNGVIAGGPEQKAINDDFTKDWTNLYKTFRLSLLDLERRAGELMREIAEIKPGGRNK